MIIVVDEKLFSTYIEIINREWPVKGSVGNEFGGYRYYKGDSLNIVVLDKNGDEIKYIVNTDSVAERIKSGKAFDNLSDGKYIVDVSNNMILYDFTTRELVNFDIKNWSGVPLDTHHSHFCIAKHKNSNFYSPLKLLGRKPLLVSYLITISKLRYDRESGTTQISEFGAKCLALICAINLWNDVDADKVFDAEFSYEYNCMGHIIILLTLVHYRVEFHCLPLFLFFHLLFLGSEFSEPQLFHSAF